MNRYPILCLGALLITASPALAQGTAAGPAQQILSAAAGAQKYTFVVFFKDNSSATQAMIRTVQQGVQSRGGRASMALVDVNNPADKAVVARFNVARAPMPLTIAVAPNGAMTGLSPIKISDEQLAKALVSPQAAVCIKSMQDGHLVFACVQTSAQPVLPQGVKEFCDDPQFKGRAVVTFLRANDPAEADFLRQLEVTQAPTTVLLAPPGVVVGRFNLATAKEQLAAALHQAGKCCDDPNCKHGQHGSQSAASATNASRSASPTARPGRN